MKRLLFVRLLIGAVGVVVWGYGYRYDDANARLAAMGILVVALALRFVPRSWMGG